MGQLTGKAALVTGGGRGIGAAIARRLAQEGADVAVTYAKGAASAEAVAAQVRGLGRQGLAMQADAADAGAVMAAVDQVAAAFGRLDILVNNAGTFVPAPIGEATMEAFDLTFGINVRGLFAATVAAARHMGEGGRIVQIGSINADRMTFAGGAIYAASKGAVQAMTRGFARDLGPRGITVNVVQPGPVDTELNPDGSELADMLKAQMAVARYARADEVAALVAFLAGPEAAMITGSAYNVDGGFGA